MFLIDAALINASVILTTGVFLSGFVIHLKGTDFTVALLNNSAIWASIFMVFSYLILEKLKTRKKLLIIVNIISRLLSISIVFLPLLINEQKILIWVLSLMVIMGNFLWGFYQLGWMIWYMEIAPLGKKNNYIYLRMLIIRIANTIVIVSAGFILDFFDKGYTGFLIIYIASLILFLGDIVVLLFVEEPEYKLPEDIKNNNFRMNVSIFFEPFRNKQFVNFLTFTFMYYLGLMLSVSFTSIYLIRYLKFDYSFITLINIIMYISMIVSTRFWGKIQGQKGTLYVLKISALFVIFECLMYFFLTEKTFFILYFSPIIAGIGTGGFDVAFVTYRFDIMPQRGRSLYEGWFKAIYGISVLLAPVVGEFIMNILPELHWSWFQISKFQMLYLISFIFTNIVIILSFHILFKGNYSDSATSS